MWLITTLVAAIIATILHFKAASKKKYRFDFLALMLWGTFLMVLVDHSIAFFNEGGEFLSYTTDGIVTSSVVLGIAMLVPIVAVWMVVAFVPILHKNRT